VSEAIISGLKLHEDQRSPMVEAELKFGGPSHRVWYRVSDSPISDGAETFLVASLLPAMRRGLALRTSSSVSPKLLQNLPRVQEILHGWDKTLRPVAVAAETRISRNPSDGVGCFFSAGVDSFYTVLKHCPRVTKLIFVHGFDVPLADTRQRATVVAGVRRAAAELGKPLIEVETNLREMSDLHVGWEYYHGAALASAALLLSHQFGEVLIPASHSYADLFPWGSHPLLDPLWGTEAISFVHDGCEVTRFEKVVQIASHAVALRHLRVCWQNLDGKYNCSRCEKCVRTMISLHIAGALRTCCTFDEPLELSQVAQIQLRGASDRSFVLENLRAAEQSGRHPELAEAMKECLQRNASR